MCSGALSPQCGTARPSRLDTLLQRFAGQRLFKFAVRHQRLDFANHPNAQRLRQLRVVASTGCASSGRW